MIAFKRKSIMNYDSIYPETGRGISQGLKKK